MLTHAVLAAVLALPSQQSPDVAGTPLALPQEPAAPPAAAPSPRLDQLLTVRLKSELATPLTDAGWSADDQRFFSESVLPSLFRSRLKIVLSPEDAARFDRLKPRTEFRQELGRNVPNQDDELVITWVKNARNYACLPWSPPKDFRRPFSGMVSNLKPGLLRLWIDTRCGQTLSTELSARQIADDLAAALAEPGLAGEQARTVAYVLSGLRDEPIATSTIARASEIYAARPDADRWFADYFAGIARVETAWLERGSDIAARTTPAQFRRFYAELAKAEVSLLRAHNARPLWTESAQAMITVSMGQGDAAKHTPLYWYEQSTKADPTDARAAVAVAYAASVKWSGEAGAAWIDRVVTDAAACRDFTSVVPSMAATVMFDRAIEMKGPGGIDEAIKAPGVYERLRGVFAGYLGAKDSALAPDTARSWLLYLARKADKPADAVAILETPGFVPRPGLPLAQSVSSIRTWALLALSPQGSAIADADALLRTGDTDAALRAFQQIAPKLGQGADAALVRSRTSLIANVQEALSSGHPTELLLCPSAAPGETQSPDCLWGRGGCERIELVQTPRGPSASIRFPIIPSPTGSGGGGVTFPVSLEGFAQGYELTFQVRFISAARSSPPPVNVELNRVALRNGLERAGPLLRISAAGARFDQQHSETLTNLKAPPAGKEPTEAQHQLRVLVQGWKAEVWFDGVLADWCCGPAASDRDNKPGGWLGFSVDAGMQGESCIENLTITRLGRALEDRPRLERQVRPKAPAKSPPSNPGA